MINKYFDFRADFFRDVSKKGRVLLAIKTADFRTEF